MVRQCLAISLSATLVLAGCGTTPLPGPNPAPAAIVATTPQAAIKHVVVIFGENISFDHYFGTYPNAANTSGTTFTAAAGTPTNISNYISTPTLLTANPNLNSANLLAASNSVPSNPFRLAPNQAGTNDQDHNYGPEQVAFDSGKMDLFPLSVGVADTAAQVNETAAPGTAGTTALTMGYYDGNTVTPLGRRSVRPHRERSTWFPARPMASSATPRAPHRVSSRTARAAIRLSAMKTPQVMSAPPRARTSACPRQRRARPPQTRTSAIF
jgi:phospholipase C